MTKKVRRPRRRQVRDHPMHPRRRRGDFIAYHIFLIVVGVDIAWLLDAVMMLIERDKEKARKGRMKFMWITATHVTPTESEVYAIFV